MSDRERKRAERRKRKHRSVEQRQDPAPLIEPASNDSNGAEPPVDLVSEAEAKAPSRSEFKNVEAREALDPLEEGERPGVVTLGAVASILIAVSILIGYFAGIEVDPDDTGESFAPNAFQALPPAILFAVMAWGMWGGRYWAVLGFQAMMAIFMLVSFISLVGATSTIQAIGAGAILLASGAFFWFTVKALARIQMPTFPTGK